MSDTTTPEPTQRHTKHTDKMNIIAKMRCDEVTKTSYGAELVKLNAVYGDSPENKSFSEATPSASIQMTVTNKEAHGAFVPGGEYFIRFEAAQ